MFARHPASVFTTFIHDLHQVLLTGIISTDFELALVAISVVCKSHANTGEECASPTAILLILQINMLDIMFMDEIWTFIVSSHSIG